jgi:hypothetical protein
MSKETIRSPKLLVTPLSRLSLILDPSSATSPKQNEPLPTLREMTELEKLFQDEITLDYLDIIIQNSPLKNSSDGKLSEETYNAIIEGAICGTAGGDQPVYGKRVVPPEIKNIIEMVAGKCAKERRSLFNDHKGIKNPYLHGSIRDAVINITKLTCPPYIQPEVFEQLVDHINSYQPLEDPQNLGLINRTPDPAEPNF